MRRYWAKVYGCSTLFGPFDTREEAFAAASKGFLIPAKEVMTVMTGYGTFGPSFDIQWAPNPEWSAR
jgi:hypothetical protein